MPVVPPSGTAAQLPPIPRMTMPGNAIRGDVVVPLAKTERLALKHFQCDSSQPPMGKCIIWKHVVRRLPPNNFNKNSMMVWLYNFSHPGPTVERVGATVVGRNGETDWLLYDPKHLRVTPRYLSFDAPAGDHIFYVVASR